MLGQSVTPRAASTGAQHLHLPYMLTNPLVDKSHTAVSVRWCPISGGIGEVGTSFGPFRCAWCHGTGQDRPGGGPLSFPRHAGAARMG